MSRPYLDFYQQNDVIPVGQDITSSHFSRRTHLYRQLGCPPLLFRDKSILEIGAGTGDNAVVTSTYGPASYALWDGNKASVEALQKKISSGLILNAYIENIDVMSPCFEQRKDVFDVVICEGASAQYDPGLFYKKIMAKMSPVGGVSIFTCSSNLSCISEMLRRIWYLPLKSLPFDESIKIGAEVFSTHLNNLKGVSRTASDWFIDSVLNPIPKSFSIDFVALLDIATKFRNIHFLGSSSPQFMEDCKWYKSYEAGSGIYNAIVQEQWNAKKLCLIDVRVSIKDVYSARQQLKEVQGDIEIISGQISEHIAGIYVSDGNRCEFNVNTLECYIDELISLLSVTEVFDQTIKSLRDFKNAMRFVLDGNPYADTGGFAGFWGRGQQYISLMSDSYL